MQILTHLSEPFVSACGKLSTAKRRVFKDKQSIYVGRPRGRTFVIKRGYVRLIYIQPDGRSWTRMILGPGALIGELPFQPGNFLTDEGAVASGPVCLSDFERAEIEHHATADPDFQLLLLKTTASQLQFIDRRMQWQMVTPLRTRIALALSDLMCFAAGHCGHGHLVDVRLTHEEFAQFVVAARPAVSEVLAEFKSAEVIDYTRSHLCLLDLDGLRSIAGV